MDELSVAEKLTGLDVQRERAEADAHDGSPGLKKAKTVLKPTGRRSPILRPMTVIKWTRRTKRHMRTRTRLTSGQSWTTRRLLGVLPLLVLIVACSDTPLPVTTLTAPSSPVSPAPPAVGELGTLVGGVTEAPSARPMGGVLVQWRFGPEFWRIAPQVGRVRMEHTAYPFRSLGSPIPSRQPSTFVHPVPGSFAQNKEVAVAGETVLNFELKPAPASSGTVTLSAVRSQQPQCDFYTSRVGKTEPLWLTMESTGESVRLTLSANGPPEVGPDGHPLSFFVGSPRGDVLEAEYKGPLSQLICSPNGDFAREVGGMLIATISGNEISGEYTAVYGNGSHEVTFVFRFSARL